MGDLIISGFLYVTRIIEDLNKDHWFEGVLNDDPIQKFLDDILLESELPLPKLPSVFFITTLNPATTGSRGGIRILQLDTPFRLGRIKVEISESMWKLTTSNIRRFKISKDPRQEGIDFWSIDKNFLARPMADLESTFFKSSTGWEVFKFNLEILGFVLDEFRKNPKYLWSDLPDIFAAL